MEDVLQQVQNVFGAFKEVSTFEAFTKQAAHLMYEELHAKKNDENLDEVYGHFFPDLQEEIVEALVEVTQQEKVEVSTPTYEIKEKEVKRVKNPMTGRDINVGGSLFKELVETGWLDPKGNPLKEYKVRKIVSPKSKKPVTVGLKAYNDLVEEGWIDKDGLILKVKHPQTEQPLDVHDPEFLSLVEKGVFKPDGTFITAQPKTEEAR